MVFICAMIMLPPTAGRKGRGTVAETVINILASEWPLSMKSIHHRLEEKHSIKVSFQALHKATKKLLDDEIVAKEQRLYLLNRNWINSIHEFTSQMKKDYEEKAMAKTLEKDADKQTQPEPACLQTNQSLQGNET